MSCFKNASCWIISEQHFLRCIVVEHFGISITNFPHFTLKVSYWKTMVSRLNLPNFSLRYFHRVGDTVWESSQFPFSFVKQVYVNMKEMIIRQIVSFLKNAIIFNIFKRQLHGIFVSHPFHKKSIFSKSNYCKSVERKNLFQWWFDIFYNGHFSVINCARLKKSFLRNHIFY